MKWTFALAATIAVAFAGGGTEFASAAERNLTIIGESGSANANASPADRSPRRRGATGSSSPILKPVNSDTPILLYRFSGVRDDGRKGAANRTVATTMHCTNGAAATVKIRITLYNYNATFVGSKETLLAPNWTYTVSTQPTTVYTEDGFFDSNAISQGQGFITTNHAKVYCSAQVVDALNPIPQMAVALEMHRMIPN